MLPRAKLIFSVFLLLVLLVSCQAASALFDEQQRGATPVESLPPHPAATATHSPTPIATLTLTVTPTLPPTIAPTATSTATPPSTPAPEQFSIFEDLWTTIRDEYLYPDFNGLNWDKVHTDYLERIQAGLYPADFYKTMEEMVELLNDEHSFFLSPVDATSEDEEYAGQNDFVGIGILTVPVPERERITIVLVFPGSPAHRAGLESHDSILAVDGKPILDESGFRRDLLRGPEGSEVEVTVQTPGEPPREVLLDRSRVTGAIPVPWSMLVSPNGKRIGYLLIASFADETIDDQIAKNLKQMSEAGHLDGLIIDNRQNSGGSDEVAKGVLSFFTNGLQGYFVDRYNSKRPLHVESVSIGGSSDLPIVILIGPETVSFGEIFSGVLQDSGRAYLIGETTRGNIELLWGYDFEDGSRAWIAHEAFHPSNHPDENWEETGIVPDLTVTSLWDLVTLETDLAVSAALDYFDQLP